VTITAPAPIVEPRTGAVVEEKHVDVSREAHRLGFRHDVRLTRDVWLDSVYWDDAIEEHKTGYSAQETDGRLRDLLWQALLAAKRAPRRSRCVWFTIDRVPVDTKGAQARPVTFVMTIGPSADYCRPIITIDLGANA